MISGLFKNLCSSSLALVPLGSKQSSNNLLKSTNFLRFEFSQSYKNRTSSESLLKQYFSSRLSLSTSQLQGFIVDLSKLGNVKIKDHRWQNLCMTIEKYQKEFSLASKIEISRMKQDNMLFLNLFKNIVAEFHHLSLGQAADLIWSMIKVKHSDKAVIMAVYKKLHEIMNNNQKIVLYNENQHLPLRSSVKSSVNDQQTEKVHHLHEGNFVRLVWALQKSKIIDGKLLAGLLKHVLQDKESQNLQKIRLENLSLLAFCIIQIQIQKYRVTDSIILQIMKLWPELPSLSILSLNLMCQTFARFISYKADYIAKYQNDWKPQEVEKNLKFVEKQKKFLCLIIETIFLRQDQDVPVEKSEQNAEAQDQKNQQEKMRRLKVPLSGKFASQILYNLARVGLYSKPIWYKLLKSVTDDIDHVETLDLSMSLCAVCDYANKKFISDKDYKDLIYDHKAIITRRLFQIHSSLGGRTLEILHEYVHNRKIQKQLVPAWIRKVVQKEYNARKMQQEQKASENFNTNSTQDKVSNIQQNSEITAQNSAEGRSESKRKSNQFKKNSNEKSNNRRKKSSQWGKVEKANPDSMIIG